MGSDLPYSCNCGSIRIVGTERGNVISYRCDNGIYHSVTLNKVNTGHYAIQIQGNSGIAPLIEISIGECISPEFHVSGESIENYFQLGGIYGVGLLTQWCGCIHLYCVNLANLTLTSVMPVVDLNDDL